MIEQLIKVFEDFTMKRFFVILIISIILVLIFPVIDNTYLYNIRMKNRIEILDEVSKLDTSIIANNPILFNEYNQILVELEKHNNEFYLSSSSIFKSTTSDRIKLLKFLSGAFWSFLIILLSPFIYKKDIKQMLSAILMFIVLGSILGYVGQLIPTFNIELINYLSFPIFQIVIVAAIAVVLNKKNKQTNI